MPLAGLTYKITYFSTTELMAKICRRFFTSSILASHFRHLG
jgi:hypothetical protein